MNRPYFVAKFFTEVLRKALQFLRVSVYNTDIRGLAAFGRATCSQYLGCISRHSSTALAAYVISSCPFASL
jgi:hypothetical protein